MFILGNCLDLSLKHLNLIPESDLGNRDLGFIFGYG